MILLIIQNILKRYGEWDIKLKHKSKQSVIGYTQLKQKVSFYFVCMTITAITTPLLIYRYVWFRRGGDAVVYLLQRIFKIDYLAAVGIYDQVFRNNTLAICIISITIIFFILLRIILNWFTKYFDMINQGIDALLSDDAQIYLPPEMAATERKLNAMKLELKQRTLEAEQANQRKNDLVMYLAHDIRTPLTSVIGYLNLMAEAPDLPVEQRIKYMNITLDKAYRLENMINEFFEITRYNLQQIHISKEKVDLYYMLVQLSDELSPVLSANRNSTTLRMDENLTVYADPDKLARVFNNILKNAAAYSLPDTEIIIFVEEKEDMVAISFINKGKTIPKEKLSSLFKKFYRLDESRSSNTGGAGLGLAIAREIITLHGGTLTADCENDTIIFMVTLPKSGD